MEQSVPQRGAPAPAEDDAQRIKLRLHYNGSFQQDGPSSWRYVGGEVYNESFPLRCGYAEVSKRLNDKFGDTVSFKYLSPGEEMDPDNLVQVQGDDDLREMYDEYLNALQKPSTPVKTLRIKVFVFRAVIFEQEVQDQGDDEEEVMDEEAAVFDEGESGDASEPEQCDFNNWTGPDGEDDDITASTMPSAQPSSDAQLDARTLAAGSQTAAEQAALLNITRGVSGCVVSGSIAGQQRQPCAGESQAAAAAGLAGAGLAQHYLAPGWRAGASVGYPHGAPLVAAQAATGARRLSANGVLPAPDAGYYPSQYALAGGMITRAPPGWIFGAGGDAEEDVTAPYGDGYPDGAAEAVYEEVEAGEEGAGAAGADGGEGEGVAEGWEPHVEGGEEQQLWGVDGRGTKERVWKASGLEWEWQQAVRQQQQLFPNGGWGSGAGQVYCYEKLDPPDPYDEAIAARGLNGMRLEDRPPVPRAADFAAGGVDLPEPRRGLLTAAAAAALADGVVLPDSLGTFGAASRDTSQGGGAGSGVILPSLTSVYGVAKSLDGRTTLSTGGGAGGSSGRPAGAAGLQRLAILGGNSRPWLQAAEQHLGVAAGGGRGGAGGGGQEQTQVVGDSRLCITQEFGTQQQDSLLEGALDAGAGEGEDGCGRGGGRLSPLSPLDPLSQAGLGPGGEGGLSPSGHNFLRGVVKKRRNEVTILTKIGEGAFGEVSQAQVFPYGIVAIKWLKRDRFAKYSESFQREAETLAKLNHPNIIRMYGLVMDTPDPTGPQGAGGGAGGSGGGAGGSGGGGGGPGGSGASTPTGLIGGIITEFVRNGSLGQYLRSLGGRRLSLRQRAMIALQASLGMAYLHEQSPAVVHFDLKPDNLLVDGEGDTMVIKVADFGLSKHKLHSHVSCRDLRGTLPYMAYELVSNNGIVSEKVDVYSMGVVMWEMYTGEVPFANLTAQDILMGLVHGNLHLAIPPSCEPEWRSLVETCMDPNPANRPSFQELAMQLQEILRLERQGSNASSVSLGSSVAGPAAAAATSAGERDGGNGHRVGGSGGRGAAAGAGGGGDGAAGRLGKQAEEDGWGRQHHHQQQHYGGDSGGGLRGALLPAGQLPSPAVPRPVPPPPPVPQLLPNLLPKQPQAPAPVQPPTPVGHVQPPMPVAGVQPVANNPLAQLFAQQQPRQQQAAQGLPRPPLFGPLGLDQPGQNGLGGLASPALPPTPFPLPNHLHMSHHQQQQQHQGMGLFGMQQGQAQGQGQHQLNLGGLFGMGPAGTGPPPPLGAGGLPPLVGWGERRS